MLLLSLSAARGQSAAVKDYTAENSPRKVEILLGPGVNICRSPLCGRSFEYFGEDPYLTSKTAVGYIFGLQNGGVMATIKHFALNNQEWSRHHVSPACICLAVS